MAPEFEATIVSKTNRTSYRVESFFAENSHDAGVYAAERWDNKVDMVVQITNEKGDPVVMKVSDSPYPEEA